MFARVRHTGLWALTTFLAAASVAMAATFTATTTGQTVDAIERVALPSRQIDFSPNSMLMGYTLGGQTFGAVPPSLTLTSVTLYDLTDLGTGGTLGATSLPTVSLYGKQGTELLGTANRTGAGEPVLVRLADGSEVSLTPVTYTFVEKNLTLDGTATYRLTLNAAGVTPTLPLFTNAATAGDSGFNLTDVSGCAPFLAIMGEVTVTDVALRAEDEASLSALLGEASFTDDASRIVTVALAEGATLTLDRTIANATLVFEAEGAAAVTFASTVNMTCPFVFRNAAGVADGVITLSGPWEDVSANDGKQIWQPKSLAIDCDVNVDSPLPFIASGWFQQKSVRVLPGRTLRLTHEAATAERLPIVALTAPTANLAFADTEKAAASAEKPSIPEKYLPLFTGTSGTITFERPVKLNKPTASQVPGEGSFIRIGAQGNENYQIALVMEDTFTTGSWRTHLGGVSGLATLELRNGTGSGVYGLCFEGNAAFSQWAGDFDMAVGARWATEFVGSSATLQLGDGDAVNGAATTTMHGIKEGDGAADITVNSDATLLLDKIVSPFDKTQDDYALYPAGKRSLKVQGGTVRAKEGDITMAFVNPEPQAAPMAVAEIPGIEVVGSAQLQAATGASLTIDTLKGDGTVSFDGNVTIGSALAQEGSTLTFDNYPLSEGAATLEAVSGTGTVIFGKLGAAGTTGVQKVADALEAGNFTGTLSFLVKTGESAEEKDYPEVDFAATDVPRLPYTLAVQPGQTLVMRLDQYVDAKIVWPTDCSDVKLILVEAGPFGGEATLPAWPEDVTFAFHRYDTGSDNIPGSASTHSPIAKPDYDFSVDVNQGTVDLTWKDPVLTGKVAWIDMEFNGDSRNSGWYRLGDDDHNGMLSGWSDAESQGAGELITRGSAFKTTHNPQSEGLDNTYKAYLSDKTFRLPEEQWSIVARIQAPVGMATDVDSMLHSNSALLAIGSNYQAQSTDGVLVLATGELKGDRRTSASLSSDIDTRTDELILWFIPRNDGDSMVRLATARVPNVTDSWHLFTITYDNGVVSIWLEENQLMRCVLPPNTTIGPGLQIGQTMGGTNRDEGIYNTIHDIGDNWTIDGCFDFLRVYRGILTESARESLVRQYPYVHKEIFDLFTTRDVRYVRELDGGTQYWVDNENKPWTRYYKENDTIWSSTGKYAEPAEGALVILECESDTTLLVNTTKHDQFPSANRTYAQLVVRGGGILGNRYGKLTIKPCEDWKTATTTEDGEYTYGRLIFSGGAGERVSQHANGDENGEGTDAVYTWNNAVFWASVVDFSRAGFSFKEERHVEMRVDTETEGSTFFRGVEEELMFVRQLTGTVSGTGYFDRNDDAIDAAYGQNSEFVWVPGYNGLNPWKVDDVTREYNDTNGDGTCDGTEIVDRGNGVLLPQEGLFVRCMKVPGTLYLEQHVDSEVPENGALSKQKWYRYGYHGDTAAESPWNLAPEEAKEGDFEKAVVLKIRLEDGQTKTLRVDQATTLQELIIEEPAEKYNPTDADEGLVLLPAADGTRLTVTEAVTTARRLDVYDPDALSTETGGTGADAILLRPKTEEVVDVATGESTTVVTGGTLLHGVNQGAYVVGNSTINHPLDGSSIARIESEKAITFTAAQDLSATTLAAAEDAALEQTGVATETATAEQVGAANGFVAKAMELAQGSRFRFASSAATVDEGITFLGAATLEGTGTVATLTPNAGLVAGEVESAKAILDAQESASWKLLNREVGGLPLTKVGAGVADIATDLPPNAGFVDVQAGTLRVATGLAGEGQAVGRASLNVAEDATLAPTSGTIVDDVLAEIPAGQTVSGLGRIDGILRLEQDATLDATTVTDDLSLSVGSVQTDGKEALADVAVALPEKTHEGLVFLRSDETMLNWAARARLLATDPTPTRWEVLLRYRPAPESPEGSDYLVGVPGLDVPVFPDDEPQPGEGENAWPEGDDVAGEVTDQVQGGGQIAGGSEGFTQATTKRLTATDIANAYRCFQGVWALSPRTKDQTSEDYATVDLLMAYEFGISRMALVSDGGTEQVLVEVTLRNVLGSTPAFEGRDLQGVDTHKPSFADGVFFTLVGPEGTTFTATEIDAAKANALGFDTALSTQETARWFLIPYTEEHFPAGKAMTIDVRVAKETAASDD